MIYEWFVESKRTGQMDGIIATQFPATSELNGIVYQVLAHGNELIAALRVVDEIGQGIVVFNRGDEVAPPLGSKRGGYFDQPDLGNGDSAVNFVSAHCLNPGSARFGHVSLTSALASR